MIRVGGLRFTYPGAKQETLHGLDFEVADQEIFGFLGPSGAGKSTTLGVLIGLLRDYSGRVEVMGRELADWADDYYEGIGVSFELPNHYLKLTARENLEFFRSLYRGETHDPAEVLDQVGLLDDADRRVDTYSKGMKVRLNVARSLIHQPRLLFLDEPTAGLDPTNARRIRDLILRLRKQGATVFVTTHDMTVADELCDRVAFITDGELDLIDAPGILKRRYGKRALRVEYRDGDGLFRHAEFPLDGLRRNEVFLKLIENAERVETIHTLETTLANIFIEVTGRGLNG